MLALKKILLGFLAVFLLFMIYAVHAGVAVVQVKAPDTRLWIPIPIALAQLAGNFIEMPLSKQEEFRQFLQYREPLKEVLNQLLVMPDSDLAHVCGVFASCARNPQRINAGFCVFCCHRGTKLRCGFSAFFTFSLMCQVSSALMASLLIGARHVPSNHESETPRWPS